MMRDGVRVGNRAEGVETTSCLYTNRRPVKRARSRFAQGPRIWICHRHPPSDDSRPCKLHNYFFSADRKSVV